MRLVGVVTPERESLCLREDGRWLAYHFDAPPALIAMFGSGPKSEKVGLERDLNGALSAITRLSHQGQAAWRSAWRKERKRWQREQKQKDRRRAELGG